MATTETQTHHKDNLEEAVERAAAETVEAVDGAGEVVADGEVKEDAAAVAVAVDVVATHNKAPQKAAINGDEVVVEVAADGMAAVTTGVTALETQPRAVMLRPTHNHHAKTRSCGRHSRRPTLAAAARTVWPMTTPRCVSFAPTPSSTTPSHPATT